MNKTSLLSFVPLALIFIAGCESEELCALNDANCDGVPDDLGRATGGGMVQLWDRDGDGRPEGYAIDRTGDGQPDALGLDTNGDGFVDSVDLDFDGVPDETTPNGTFGQPGTLPGTGAGGTVGGGETGVGGTPVGTGGSSPGTGGGSTGTGGDGEIYSDGNCLDDEVTHVGSGEANGTLTGNQQADDQIRYARGDSQRGGMWYKIIANGWGDGWEGHHLVWEGTKLSVESFDGYSTGQGVPAGYPSVYMGDYSTTGASFRSPFPLPVAQASKVDTGLRWNHTGTGTEYNVAWDIWLTNGSGLSAYFMVWLNDPPSYEPAGGEFQQGITVPGVPGVWDIRSGTVSTPLGTHPIINYSRPDGTSTKEFHFNLETFFSDATGRGLSLNGTQIMSVAIGFELWDGPVSNLTIEDFCVGISE